MDGFDVVGLISEALDCGLRVDHLLFHFLDGHHFVRLPISTDPHFSESSAADDLPGYEISDRYLSPLKTIIFTFFM